ncbi:MAG: hypothetical protein KatS3mg013_2041 [Actinomycetota bacterium]|jgi:hypothetical protein|nr:MAG: hypothetical protein KatS3mg013_2041 [Actinomycetota bacterium]
MPTTTGGSQVHHRAGEKNFPGADEVDLRSSGGPDGPVG